MKVATILSMLAMFTAAEALAQAEAEGVRSFQQNQESWRRQEEAPAPMQIVENFRTTLNESAVQNIVDAEQVFCYEVANKPGGFKGYTMDGMAITGFCGLLNKELSNMIAEQLFAREDNVSFNTSESCNVNPRLILRFVRGIDHTDVLLSSPCHSIAVFYAGNVNVFNMKPSAELISTIVDSFNENRVDFVSPALLNQLLPIGVVQTPEQQRLVDNKGVERPVRNWNAEPVAAPVEEQPRSGWNNLAI